MCVNLRLHKVSHFFVNNLRLTDKLCYKGWLGMYDINKAAGRNPQVVGLQPATLLIMLIV